MTQTRIDWKLVLLSLLAILLLSHAVTAGFPEDWAYRKQFTLNNSGSDLTDYQLKFTVYRSSGSDSGFEVYVDTNCEEDYDDIRFTMANGAICPYWIESSDSSSATIWVKVPSIPAGDTILYLYYGNPNATSVSNGDNTFVFFDDFNDNSLNTSKWTVVSGGGSATVYEQNNRLEISSDGSNRAYARTATSFPSPYVLEFSAKKSENVETVCHWDGNIQGAYDLINTGYYAPMFVSWFSPPLFQLIKFSSGSQSALQSYSSSLDSNWHSYSVRTSSSGISVSFDNTQILSTTDTTRTTGYIGLSARETPNAINAYYDTVRVRKWIDPEPTISSWGSEETPLLIVTPDFSGTPTSGESPLTVYFSDASTGCTTWPNSSINIDYWEWDFGDGSPKNYQQNPAHTYTQTGYFNVSLKSGNLTYGEYNTTIKNNYINVVVNPNVPVAEFTATPTCANTGTTIYFIDYSTGGGLYAWNWSFGDGTYSTLRNPTHQYSSNGLYDISLTVWGAYGSDTETKSGYIQIPCPTPTPTPTPTPSPTPIPTPTGTPPIQGEIPQARIPVLGFMVLAWVDLGLILYTFIDNENRNYMHIYSAVIAVILSFLLAVSLTNGFITEAHVLTDKEVTVNSSVLSTHLVEHVAVTDTGWSWFFAFLGVMMLIICVLSAIEAVRENTEEVI